ncbi:MAG TPA: hypothetical protein QF555_04785 [Candidatus Thalassarchaeaceae archaeon]|nr:hypothetical protein [Candidatus Thalassarchaeaceae archaeon]|tara:strand:- start:63 stop:1112 length:1050 start_codon:yes stop_codon:yes gene_type:complete
MEGSIPTCWVIDHPAHFQLFSPFIRGGHPDDILVLTSRTEVQIMFRTRDGRIPHRPHLWVERPVGLDIGRFERFRIARRRIKMVRKFLHSNSQIQRIVVKGASLELIAAKRAGISERIYISDTEVNHIAHRIAKRYATEILLPKSWKREISGNFVSDSRVRRYSGILPEVYVDIQAGKSIRKQAISQIREEIQSTNETLSDAPVIFHRLIHGGGIHDDSELINYDYWIKDLPVHFVHTKESTLESTDAAWEIPTQIAMFDGVLTGSTTLASEAVIQGIPTLLISRAERGFLDDIEHRFPRTLFRWKSLDRSGIDEIFKSWIQSIIEQESRTQSIHNNRSELEELIGPIF